jgi:hypothetical protein
VGLFFFNKNDSLDTERSTNMPKYRMKFGRNDDPKTQVIERDFDDDQAALLAFGEERGKKSHEWNALQILDRVEYGVQVEETTRIASEDKIAEPDNSILGIVRDAQSVISDKVAVKTTLQTIEGRLIVFKRKLDEIVFPIVEKAVTKYNEGQGYNIIFQQSWMGYGVTGDKLSFRMTVRLKSSTGHEPDEEFDNDDEGFKAKFNEVLQPMLQEAGLDIEFSGFSFPTSYYMV